MHFTEEVKYLGGYGGGGVPPTPLTPRGKGRGVPPYPLPSKNRDIATGRSRVGGSPPTLHPGGQEGRGDPYPP